MVVALLTGIGLVAAALIIARLISPRSFSLQKGEPYECGVETRGESMVQFKVGYYLFAILFLMFDVETVFLFPWAAVCRMSRPQRLVERFGVLGSVDFRPCLCLAERSIAMEVKIKNMKREDFKDNEYIDKLVEELNASGTNVVVGQFDKLINWGRANSLWPLCFGTSCCAIEFYAPWCWRVHDMARFGFEVARNSARQADYIMVQGTIVHRMAPALVRLWEQLAEPKYAIACGGCAVSGGPFKGSYCVVDGVDQLIPIDVYIPGCPPRPEAMFYRLDAVAT